MIQTKTVIAAAAALALVGAMFWGSSHLLDSESKHRGSVAVTSVDDKAWSVEVKSIDDNRTASLQR